MLRNPAFGRPNRQQREWLLLTSACLLKLVAGQLVAGPVYANCMRSAFGLNQSELNVAMLMLYNGTVLSILTGLLLDRWGTRLVVIIGGVASTTLSLILTLAFAFPVPLRGRPWLLWLLLFTYSHSFNYAEVAATAAALSGFRWDRRGRVMSAVDNCFNLGAPLTALVHYLLFANVNKPPEEQSAVGTQAVLTVFTAFVHAFSALFIAQPGLARRVAAANAPADAGGGDMPMGERTPILSGDTSGSSTNDLMVPVDENDEDYNLDLDEESAHRPNLPATEFLRATCSGCLSGWFLLLLVGFALAMAQSLAVWLNVTTVTRSLGLSRHDVAYFWLPVVLAVLWRCALGPATDRCCAEPHKRAAVLCVSVAAFGTPAMLLITLPIAQPGASLLGATLASYSLSSLMVASLFVLGPVLLSQVSQPELFGRLYSICLLTGTALSLPLTVQSGLMYHRRAAELHNGTLTDGCQGQECYRFGNYATTGCHAASVLCLLVLPGLLWWRSKRSQS